MTEQIENPYENPEHQTADALRKPKTRWIEILVVVAVVIVLVGLIAPSRRGAPRVVHRMQCANSVRQMALALLNYEQTYKRFPPAYTVDQNGNRLHSWRTLILPYLEQTNLYATIDLSKAWDDPANDIARATSVEIYQCKASKLAPGTTTYMSVVSDQSCLQGGKGRLLSEITDGPSQTLLVFEADPSQAVHWMSPNDMDEAGFLALAKATKPAHNGGRNIAFADGSATFISNALTPEQLRPIVTVNANEPFDQGVFE